MGNRGSNDNDASPPLSPAQDASPAANRGSSGSGGGGSGRKQPPAKKKVLVKVGNNLYGRTSLFIHKVLPTILGTKPFYVKRHQNQENVTNKRFLYDLCGEKNLPKTGKEFGKKEALIQSLVNYYFEEDKLAEFELDFAGRFNSVEFKKAKEADEDTKREIEASLLEHRTRTNSHLSTTLREFGTFFLSNVFFALKCGLFPLAGSAASADLSSDDDSTGVAGAETHHDHAPDADMSTFFFNDCEFRTDYVLSALSGVDTTLWEQDPSSAWAHGANVSRKTPACALRAFLIILGDDRFFRRLVTESKSTPSRQELDAGAHGDRRPFWVDVCAAFIDNDYEVPPIPNSVTDLNFFKDKEGRLFDVSSCHSPWVQPRHIRRWYTDASNSLMRYRAKYDTSGRHNFSLEHVDDFYDNFLHGDREAGFLSCLALDRGDEALQWFDGKISAEPQDLVDGLLPYEDETPAPSAVQEVGSVREEAGGDEEDDHSMATTRTGLGTLDSSRDAIHALAQAISKTQKDSPERAKYYSEKNKEIEERREQKSKKRRLDYVEKLFALSKEQLDECPDLAARTKALAKESLKELLDNHDKEVDSVPRPSTP